MTQAEVLKKLLRAHWRALERMLKTAYQAGHAAGLARAHGQRRQGRTIRGDATVAGLTERIERHFGLDRYGFEVRIVHRSSSRRVPSADRIDRYRTEE